MAKKKKINCIAELGPTEEASILRHLTHPALLTHDQSALPSSIFSSPPRSYRPLSRSFSLGCLSPPLPVAPLFNGLNHSLKPHRRGKEAIGLVRLGLSNSCSPPRCEYFPVSTLKRQKRRRVTCVGPDSSSGGSSAVYRNRRAQKRGRSAGGRKALTFTEILKRGRWVGGRVDG